MALTRNLTVALPPGSPIPTAHRDAITFRSSFVRLLAAPEHVSLPGRLPGSAVLTFHIGHPAGSPFIAWLSNGQWIPVPSKYDAAAGTVSARVSHFSTWAPFAWLTTQLKQWATAAVKNVLGLGAVPGPDCGGAKPVPVTDSNPSHHTIGACAAQAAGLPFGNVQTKIVNLRQYPVDLSYPASTGSSCGSYGKCIQVTSQDDLWLKLGSALSLGQDSVLVPGGSAANAIDYVRPGSSASFQTAVDGPAAVMGDLEAGINFLVTIVATKYKSVATASTTVDALLTNSCLTQVAKQATGPLTAATTGSLTSAAAGCLATVVPDVLDKLRLKTASFLWAAITTGINFVSQSFSTGLWGPYDQVVGGHVLTVAGPVPQPTPAPTPTPSPSPILSPGKSVTVTVSSTQFWQPTGIYLTQGQQYTVQYISGSWTVDYRNFPYVGPGGYSDQVDAKIYQDCKFDGNVNYAVLFGEVGSESQDVTDAVPIGNGGMFHAQAPSSSISGAPNSGPLYFMINDTCLSDNAGSVTMRVSVP